MPIAIMSTALFCRSALESKLREVKWRDHVVIATLSWLLILPGFSPGRPLSPDLNSGWTVIRKFQRQDDCQSAANAIRTEAYGSSAVDTYNGLDETKGLDATETWQAENARCVKEGNGNTVELRTEK